MSPETLTWTVYRDGAAWFAIPPEGSGMATVMCPDGDPDGLSGSGFPLALHRMVLRATSVAMPDEMVAVELVELDSLAAGLAQFNKAMADFRDQITDLINRTCGPILRALEGQGLAGDDEGEV
jgi:hypothetical protein